jgi:hypothetical protein
MTESDKAKQAAAQLTKGSTETTRHDRFQTLAPKGDGTKRKRLEQLLTANHSPVQSEHQVRSIQLSIASQWLKRINASCLFVFVCSYDAVWNSEIVASK